jgi:hypothetical protein
MKIKRDGDKTLVVMGWLEVLFIDEEPVQFTTPEGTVSSERVGGLLEHGEFLKQYEELS